MKKILFLLLIPFLFTNCAKDSIEYAVDNNIELDFTSENLSLIPYDFEVDWSNHKIGHLDELNSDFEEYSVIWTGDINPEIVDKARLEVQTDNGANYKTDYKILAIKSNDTYQFYSLVSKGKNTDSQEFSFTSLANYEGLITIKNSLGDEILTNRYVNGQFKSKIYNDSKSIKNVSNKCYYTTVVTTNTYYNVRPGGELEFNFETTSTSTEVTCLQGGDSGDQNNQGSPGSPAGSNGGTTTIYNDVVLQTVLHPDCASFEFANSGPIKGAHVLGVNNTFVAAETVSPSVTNYNLHNIFYPDLFFVLPSNWTNGRAATVAAQALDRSIEKTENWFRANPNASAAILQAKWMTNMLLEFSLIGGYVRVKPEFVVRSPAPYLKRFGGTGNCG